MGWLRRRFFTGLLLLLPTVVTGYVLYRFFISVDSILLDPLVQRYPFLDIPGLGFLGVFLIILLTGVFASNFFGSTIISWAESLVFKIPLIGRVYIAIKQMSEVFFKHERTVFKRAVLIQYPRPGIYAVAFMTSTWKQKDIDGHVRTFVNIFLPTTPNPTSGFFLMVPEDETIPFDYTIEEAMKLIISAGAVLPGMNGPGSRPTEGAESGGRSGTA
jgi:uncharacterized membrane protein